MLTSRYAEVMTVQASSDADDDRRATTIRLKVEQLLWVKGAALAKRCTMNDIIEQALIAAGAPE